MRNISSFKWAIFILVLVFGFNANAKRLHDPVGLPQTVNEDNSEVYIDVNGDGEGDFVVSFDTDEDGNWCEIFDPKAVTSPSPLLSTPSILPNEVLYEVFDDSWYTTILNFGDLISSAGNWASRAYIFNDIDMDSPAPLGNNYTDGSLQGYIGIHYYTEDGMHYGWLPVQIDPGGNFVVIGTGGSGNSPEQFIQAGSGGSAVPFPIIGSIIGFVLIGGGIYLKRRKNK